MAVRLVVDGRDVEIVDEELSLLDALREELGNHTAKDGCSPQGQCGCCTVWVDGRPRVSCVTPVRRVAGRQVTTAAGLPPTMADRWSAAFLAAGATQCGFCTSGIVMRLAALEERSGGVGRRLDEAAIRTALAAHLCRCTGWQSVVAAAGAVLGVPVGPSAGDRPPAPPAPVPDLLLSAWRSELEGRAMQSQDRDSVLGLAPFADDAAPPDALVALVGPDAAAGEVVVAPTLGAARRGSRKVQGRNSPTPPGHPLELPDPPAGAAWALTLRTTWVEPAYLEPDASWCEPGRHPASSLANGGAFGGKRRSPVPVAAHALADEAGRAVRVLWPREEVVRRGPKRPPIAAGVSADGTGLVRVAVPAGSVGMDHWRRAFSALAPGLAVEEVPVAGPPVSADLRGAGWVEAAVLLAGLAACRDGGGRGEPVTVRSPAGGRATVSLGPGGAVHVTVAAGEPLDPVVLRSYCMGAVHQALGWVRSEGIALDAEGRVQDLTIRSYGILSARDTPWMDVIVQPEDRWPVNGSDAVFAATAAAAWIADGLGPEWPTGRAGVTR